MIPTSKEIRASLLAVYKTNEELSGDPYTEILHIPTLVTLIIQRMNVHPTEWDKATDKIRAHIQNSADRVGHETKKTNILVISRGAGGGVRLKEGTRL